MARNARSESETGYYHIMMRGNNKEKIFDQDSEKEYFLKQLQYQVDDNNISTTAYCLMNNHVHLLIHADLKRMSTALKWINIKFASRYNTKFERTGHVFQGRYKSQVINTNEYLLHAIRYIHNNPVKAGMVSKPSDYRWSSYNSYISTYDKFISPLEIQFVISMFSDSLKQFEDFHLDEDIYEFLEIREDLERQRIEKAQKIINKYYKKFEVVKVSELHKDIIEKLVIDLLKNSHLSHRKIAEITKLTRSKVHSIANKTK